MASDDDRLLALASEGEYYREGKVRKKDRRYYSIYDVSNTSARYIKSVSAESMGDPVLFYPLDGYLYFVKVELNPDGTDEMVRICRTRF